MNETEILYEENVDRDDNEEDLGQAAGELRGLEG